MQLPACFICTEVADVEQNSEALNEALSNGATGVVLTDESNSGEGQSHFSCCANPY